MVASAGEQAWRKLIQVSLESHRARKPASHAEDPPPFKPKVVSGLELSEQRTGYSSSRLGRSGVVRLGNGPSERCRRCVDSGLADCSDPEDMPAGADLEPLR